MRQRATGVRLDRDARIGECPGLAEFLVDCRRVIAAAKSTEETAVRFQYLLGTGPAESRKIGGKYSHLGRMSGVKRLHHGAEVFAQAGGLTGGDSIRSRDLRLVEIAQPGAGRSARTDPARSGGQNT